MGAEAFWAAWIGELPNELQRERMAQVVVSAVEQATARFPAVNVADDVFFAHVAARALAPGDAVSALERLHLVDLWIACAALHGNDATVATFDREFGPVMQRAAVRVCGDRAVADDVCQRLRAQLLMPQQDRPGTLSTYAGRSSLSAWLTVVALREAARHAKAIPQADESDLFVAAEASANPELVAIKREHAVPFREAFGRAMGGLTARERAALRYHLVEGLTIDQIAALESIHRATAARRIAGARTKIHDTVRAQLRMRLGLTRVELESLIRAVRSQLDFSVRRHLKD